MFIFGMGCTLVGAIIAFFIINKVLKKKKEPVRFDDLE
jgi:predicted membrane protein